MNGAQLTLEEENQQLDAALSWQLLTALALKKQKAEAVAILQQALIICEDEAVKEKLWLAIGVLNGVVE